MLLAALLAVAAPPGACVSVDVRVIARAPARWFDRCVRLRGYVVRNIFYADAGGAYAAAANDSSGRSNDGWLGLYLRGRQTDRLRRGTVTGILRDCGRDWAEEAARAGPNELVMSIGYCHYRGGLVLLAAQFDAQGPAHFERLTSASDRARFGDLELPGADRPVPEEVTSLADRFLSGVQAGDGLGLAAYTGTWTEQNPETPAALAAWHAYLSGDGASPLRPLRRAVVQRAYFRERPWAADQEVRYLPVWFACFCREVDCTGRWPIHGDDATAGPSRPYVCVRASSRTDRRRPPNWIIVNRTESMFAEPRTNASTR